MKSRKVIGDELKGFADAIFLLIGWVILPSQVAASTHMLLLPIPLLYLLDIFFPLCKQTFVGESQLEAL